MTLNFIQFTGPSFLKNKVNRKTLEFLGDNIKHLGAGELARWLRAFVALTEDLGLVSNTHIHGASQSSVTTDARDPTPF